MSWLDVAVIFTAVAFCIIGFCNGFLRSVLKLGAYVFSTVISCTLGAWIGRILFPNIIGADSAVAEKLPIQIIDSINETLSKFLGIIILFLALVILLRIISRFISKLFEKIKIIGVIDRILGALFGLLIAVGIICVFAMILDFIAMISCFFDTSATLYSIIEETVIFRYFF